MHRFRFAYSRQHLQSLRPQEVRNSVAVRLYQDYLNANNNTDQEIQTLQNANQRYQLSAANPVAIFENPELHRNEVLPGDPLVQALKSSVISRFVRWIKGFF